MFYMKLIFNTLVFVILLLPIASSAQFLMSDVEKGSSAVLQMQNNAIQSQYIRQNTESQMQAQQNNLERQKLEIEKIKLQIEAMKQAQEIARLKAANGEK